MIDKIKQIGFLSPQWFILLLIVPLLIYLYIKVLRKQSSSMLINGNSEELVVQKFSLSPNDYLFIIRMVAVVLIIIGIANPQIVTKTEVKKPSSETNIVFALDVSKSMLIEDIKPNRLEALKDVLNKFVTMRSQDPVGIVLYAGESFNYCPLTKNYPLLLSKINKIDDIDLNDGTAIGLGLASSVNILKQGNLKNKVIILLTDGSNNAGNFDPVLAAVIAKRYNIKIYAIGIGTNGIANIPITDINGNKTYARIYVTLEEGPLKQIAKITGGEYYRTNDANGLKNIYASINKLETKETKLITKLSYTTCFDWFIKAALILLFVEVLLKYTVLKTWPT
jgi:Ca-activated chloride channel family protein